jgi:hypothetical protein
MHYAGDCSPAMIVQMWAAAANAAQQIADCTKGECGGPNASSLKRAWLFALSTATWHCPSGSSGIPRDRFDWSVDETTGEFTNRKGEKVAAFNSDKWSIPEKHEYYLSPYIRGHRPAGDIAGYGCLAETMAHETLHESLDWAIHWSSPPGSSLLYRQWARGLDDRAYEGLPDRQKEKEETWVLQQASDCVVCQ